MSVFESLSPESIAFLSEFIRTLGATDQQLAQITEKLRTHTGISTKSKGSRGAVEHMTDGVVPTSTDQLFPNREFIKVCRTAASNREMDVFLRDHNPIVILLSISACTELIKQLDLHTQKREDLTPSQLLNCDNFHDNRIPTYNKAGELITEGRFLEAYALHFMSIELARMLTGNTRWIIATEAKQATNDITAFCAPTFKARASIGGTATRTAVSSKSSAGAGGVAIRASKPSATVCVKFNIDTQSGCSFGKKCRYLHQARPTTVAPSTTVEPPTTSSLPETAPEPATRGQDCFGSSA